MTIKEQLLDLQELIDKPEKNKPQIAAKLMQLVADLQDDNTPIPDDLFAGLNKDMLQMAAMGLVMLLMETVRT